MERLPTWSWWLPLGASWGTNPKLMLGVVGVRTLTRSYYSNVASWGSNPKLMLLGVVDGKGRKHV